MNVSAVVLSSKPVALEIPGVTVVPHVSTFADAAGLLRARLAALQKVKTEWFFFLDDDDELPADYLRVLGRCMAVDTPLAYTDELVRLSDGREQVRRSAPYSQDRHVQDFCLIHHLAVCKTEAARRAARKIPRGTYGVEPLLFFQVAKEGATYIDEVGYIWNKGSGLNRHPSLLIGLVQSATWAHRNR